MFLCVAPVKCFLFYAGILTYNVKLNKLIIGLQQVLFVCTGAVAVGDVVLKIRSWSISFQDWYIYYQAMLCKVTSRDMIHYRE